MLLPGGLTFQVDVGFDATGPFDTSFTWTTITEWVDLDQVSTATLGGSDIAGPADIGRLAIPLSNDDGRFDPDNTASPYYPNLREDKPVRVILGGNFTGQLIFTGTTEQWDAHSGRPGRATLTAQCPLGLLARHQISGIGLRDYIIRHPTRPDSYFRLGTADGVELYDEVTARHRGQYTNYHTAATSLAVSDPDDAAEVGLGIPSFVGVYGDASPTGSAGFGILVIVRCTSLPATSTTNEIWELDSPGGTLSLRVNDVGALALQGPGISIAGPTIAINTPTAVWVRRASNGTDYGIGIHTINTLSPTTTTGTGSSYAIPAGTALHVGGGPSVGADWPGQIDELCVWRTTDPGFATLADIGRRMVFGLPHMSVSARSAYMVQEAGFDAGRHTTDLVSVVLDPQVSGKSYPSGTVLSETQKIAATVAGDFFSRPDGQLVHRGFRLGAAAPTPTITFDDTLGTSAVPYSDLVISRPFTDRRAVVSASDGVRTGEVRASNDVVAPFTKAVDVHAITTDFTVHRRMATIARRFLRRLALTKPRVRLTVSVTHLTAAQRTALVQYLIRGTPVSIIHHPRSGGTTTYNAEILRTNWRLSAQGVYVDVETQPARDPWQTGFRWTSQPDSAVSSGLGQRTALSPRWDTDGHGDALTLFTEVALLPGPAAADTSIYLVGASSHWEGNVTGERSLSITDGTTATYWGRFIDRPPTTAANSVGGLVTTMKQDLTDTVGHVVYQTSGALRLFYGSAFPTTNDAFAPDLWGVRVPTANHSVCLHKPSNASIANNTTTVVNFENELWDIGGLHSTVSNTDRITPVRTGIYLIGANVAFAALSNLNRQVGVNLSGGNDRGRMDLLSGGDEAALWCVSLERITSLAGSPYFQCRVKQTSGGALNLLSGNYYTPKFWAIECSGPAARMRKTDSPSISSGFTNWTQFQSFSQVDFDTDSIISGNNLVLSEDGLWVVYGSTEYANTTTVGGRGLQIVRGGHEVVGRLVTQASSAPHAIQVVTLIEGRAGDSLQLQTAHDGGISLVAGGWSDYSTVFAAVRVSAGG
jgi:hypothetical protein